MSRKIKEAILALRLERTFSKQHIMTLYLNEIFLGARAYGVGSAAGVFDASRTGDDTSGREWERTRFMGVNTLAFRMLQHNIFGASDADCVGLTKNVPWELNKQWLDVLAKSGTPLFVSLAPDAYNEETKKAIQEAFKAAAEERVPAEPVDWMETTCPRVWKQAEGTKEYQWEEEFGSLS